MLQSLDALMFKFFDDHMFWWSYAPMPICFNDHMLACVYNFMLICLDELVITPSYVQIDNRMHSSIDIHLYDFHTHVHTLGS